MRAYKVYQVDSFTKEKFKGNPAGVVVNADGLNERAMLKIARELNNSETAFIFSPDSSDHDVRIRYFTPTMEVPICGHATIAAHYVRAVESRLKAGIVLQKVQIGVLPVDILKQDDDYSIVMTQGGIEFNTVIEGQRRAQLIAALGLTDADMNESCPIQIVSTGHSKVMIGINSREKLDLLVPDLTALKQLSAQIGCNGYFVFTMDSQLEGVLTHGRMFAPAIGIAEDPVTGNANGPLGAYLVKYGLVKHDGSILRFKAEQGNAIQRSGIIDVEVQIKSGEPVKVKVGGQAVIVFKTEIVI